MKILLLDDNISTTELLKKSIEWTNLGIDEVFTANSAAEAEQMLTRNSVDIIVCDIEMPGTNGLDFIKRQRQSGNDAICVFLTAYAEFEYAKQAIRLNSFDYILKPFSLEGITNKLQAAVNVCKERSKNSNYIKYGKAWVENQSTLTGREKEELLSTEKELENDGIRKAKSYIKDHYTDKITLNDLAEYVGYNPSYLSAMFKKHEGIPPLDYLNLTRINQAQIFLAASDFSISDIAMMVGFNSVSYFNHTYKAITGQTPGEYRAAIHARQ